MIEAGDGVVAVAGDLDAATAGQLARRLSAPPAVRVIDLSGVTFIDAGGLRVLLDATRPRRHHRCRLRAPSRHVVRLYDITELTAMLADTACRVAGFGMDEAFVIEVAPGRIVSTAVHAGHELRAGLVGVVALDPSTRLREEDPFTDRMLGDIGIRAVVNRSRFEVDLNRSREQAVYRRPEDGVRPERVEARAATG